jgi:hypothetical protein
MTKKVHFKNPNYKTPRPYCRRIPRSKLTEKQADVTCFECAYKLVNYNLEKIRNTKEEV